MVPICLLPNPTWSPHLPFSHSTLATLAMDYIHKSDSPPTKVGFWFISSLYLGHSSTDVSIANSLLSQVDAQISPSQWWKSWLVYLILQYTPPRFSSTLITSTFLFLFTFFLLVWLVSPSYIMHNLLLYYVDSWYCASFY